MANFAGYKGMRTTARVATIAVLLGASGAAFAELYVSPVVRSSVTMDAPSAPSAPAASQAEGGDGATPAASAASVRSISGRQAETGEFLMRESEETNVMKFGKNVPLFVALENLVPKDWTVKLEEGLEKQPVSWSGGDDWKGVLGAIASGNDLKLAMNEGDKRLALARNEEAATNLAARAPVVWALKPSVSMRDNLQAWAAQAGWSLDWSVDVDYPIEHAAKFNGAFEGEGGVVDQLLQGTAENTYPLSAVFYSGNKVLRVVEGGFRQDKTGGSEE